ncbi:hypothetical protein CONCODRAFT_12068 [Conidiobolus coronatus NRRL 28638]|uniref:PABC domain-containing protein n=1 Tax=Conidiobolus coronatus (strain ATCC 28846 / CBS 209.66 / NRRL 28638) TaxID=796925 RepID=A0A137NTR9_CONC2|nr:hypothetical protein CONCODRAFT_12068 [Conidiobolus coronatus NRRL 28638]|eukprot:KXN66150.1 hypothetical protein CONCODRAFT_12068 [Conidiobolus coronatus NRRL 28638]
MLQPTHGCCKRHRVVVPKCLEQFKVLKDSPKQGQDRNLSLSNMKCTPIHQIKGHESLRDLNLICVIGPNPSILRISRRRGQCLLNRHICQTSYKTLLPFQSLAICTPSIMNDIFKASKDAFASGSQYHQSNSRERLSDSMKTKTGKMRKGQWASLPDPETQKNMLGEHLFPLVSAIDAELVGSITGMLLEMDNGELLYLIENSEGLTAKVNEALDVLSNHVAGE